MNNSPKVIFNCRFTHAFNRKGSNYTSKQLNNLKKRIERKFDYFSNEEKRVMNLFEYYTGNLTKKETMNLVIEDGSYATKEEIERRKKRFVKYAENSNLWQGVISFNNDYLNQNISIHDLEQQVIKKVLPRFFKKMGFKDINNMAYNLSLHADTDNLHIHFSFIEKCPNYVYSNKKVNYRRKGELTEEEINFLKNEVVLTIEKSNYLTPMIIITNNEINKLKSYFNPKEKNFILYDKKDLIIEDKILKLGKLLYQERKDNPNRIKYNSINNKEIETLTKEIKKYLFNNKSEFHDDFIEFKKSLDNINDYLYKVNVENNVSNIKLDKSLTENKDKYVDNYILNAIVNHANYFYKNKSKKYHKLDENEILKEIILKEFKNNKTQTRFNILNNYLSNTLKTRKFQNKYKIKNAIKNINSEMEEAKQEFSKLFQVENSYERSN